MAIFGKRRYGTDDDPWRPFEPACEVVRWNTQSRDLTFGVPAGWEDMTGLAGPVALEGTRGVTAAIRYVEVSGSTAAIHVITGTRASLATPAKVMIQQRAAGLAGHYLGDQRDVAVDGKRGYYFSIRHTGQGAGGALAEWTTTDCWVAVRGVYNAEWICISAEGTPDTDAVRLPALHTILATTKWLD